MTPQDLTQEAYTEVLKTQAGRTVLTDILLRCFHFQSTTDPERRVLQQFAVETLRTARLYDTRGSFPLEYVSILTGTKLQQPANVGLFGRLFGRKNNV